MPRNKKLSKWSVRFEIKKTFHSLISTVTGDLSVYASSTKGALSEVRRRLRLEFPRWDSERFIAEKVK